VCEPVQPFRFDPDARGQVSIRYNGDATEIKID
jgi:hypothetical protein